MNFYEVLSEYKDLGHRIVITDTLSKHHTGYVSFVSRDIVTVEDHGYGARYPDTVSLDKIVSVKRV